MTSSAHITSLLMSPCLSISAYPEQRFSSSMVFRNTVSRMTQSALLNTPISFFSPPKFTPVFPPTEASTIERRVVGILINLMPRLNVEAANPPRSVTIPPPRFIISEWRVAPMRCSSPHTWLIDSSPLLVSPAGMVIIPALSAIDCTTGAQRRSVVSSQSMNSLSCFRSAMALSSASVMLSERIIFCFSIQYI